MNDVDATFAGRMSNRHFDRPIFVLGMPRSGTSLTAGCLGLCGAWLGTTVRGGGPSNPRGFFEHRQMRQEVNKGILRSLGCDTAGVRRLPALEAIPRSSSLKLDVRGILAADGYPFDRPWVFKDAKLSLTWPAFLTAFPMAQWVIVRRHPDDIVRSCQKTGFMVRHNERASFWHRLIDDYLRRIARLKETTAWWREVWPQRMIEGDFSQFEQVVNDLELAWRPDDVRQFVLPTAWHAPRTGGG